MECWGGAIKGVGACPPLADLGVRKGQQRGWHLNTDVVGWSVEGVG